MLFSSNPRGMNEEGWRSARYGVYHDLPAWRSFMTAAGFSEIEHYYRPAGLPLRSAAVAGVGVAPRGPVMPAHW